MMTKEAPVRADALFLRCYVTQRKGYFFACCIDLCLAVQADSKAEAISKMEEQIRSYVEEALTIDRAYAGQLLRRKAPLSQRLEYHWLKFKHDMRSRKKSGGNDGSAGNNDIFDEQLPMKLA